MTSAKQTSYDSDMYSKTTAPPTKNILADVKSDLSQTLDPTGKNVVEIIIAEHALVKSLAAKWDSTSDTANKQGIAYNILKLLSTHAAKEEMAVYPAIRAKLPNGPAIADHCLQEHMALKKVLYELDSMKVTDSGFDGKLRTAIQLTLEHVGEEENDILPQLQRTLSKEDLDKVTRDYTTYAAVAPTRPHPDAPNQPPANIAANTASTPLDMARDIGRFQSTTKA